MSATDITDIEPLLEEAGLRYSSDADPGFVRRRAGRGFTYLRPDGTRVTDARALARIKGLVIPPAWQDVWICHLATGHLQATGRDARERKQYRYHDEWRRLRDENKFDDLAGFGTALPRLRQQVDADLSRPGLPQEKVVALVIALLDRTLIRVGNEEYRRDNGTFGLTTLYRRHVVVDGATLRFRFKGKGGIEHEVKISDRRLASTARRCHELGGREVFSYLDAEDRLVRVDSSDCNDYLHDVVGEGTTVKTFRTWGGSVIALEELTAAALERDEQADAEDTDALANREVLAAIDVAAKALGNTRAVARRSYIHPAVIEAAVDGDLPSLWRTTRKTGQMTRAERALLKLVAS